MASPGNRRAYLDRSASVSQPRTEPEDTPPPTHRSFRHSLPTHHAATRDDGTGALMSPTPSSSRSGHDHPRSFRSSSSSYRRRLRNRMADATGSSSSSSRPASPTSADPLTVPMGLPPLSQSSSAGSGSGDHVAAADQPTPSSAPSAHHFPPTSTVRKILRLTGIGSSSRSSSGGYPHGAPASATLRAVHTASDLLSPAPSRQRSMNKVRQLTGMDLDEDDFSAQLASASMLSLTESGRGIPTPASARPTDQIWSTSIFDSDEDEDEDDDDDDEADDDETASQGHGKGKHVRRDSDPADGLLSGTEFPQPPSSQHQQEQQQQQQQQQALQQLLQQQQLKQQWRMRPSNRGMLSPPMTTKMLHRLSDPSMTPIMEDPDDAAGRLSLTTIMAGETTRRTRSVSSRSSIISNSTLSHGSIRSYHATAREFAANSAHQKLREPPAPPAETFRNMLPPPLPPPVAPLPPIPTSRLPPPSAPPMSSLPPIPASPLLDMPDMELLPNSPLPEDPAEATADEVQSELMRWPTAPTAPPPASSDERGSSSSGRPHGRGHAHSHSGSSAPKFLLFPPKTLEASSKASPKAVHRHMSIASLSGPPRALASMTQQQQQQIQQQHQHQHQHQHMRSKSNSSAGEATLHSTSSSGASSRYSCLSTFSVGGVSLTMSETSVSSVLDEEKEEEQEQEQEEEDQDQDQDGQAVQPLQLTKPYAPLPLALPSRPARPSRPEELVLPVHLGQAPQVPVQQSRPPTPPLARMAEQPRSAFDDDDDDDRQRLRDSVRWSALMGKGLGKKLRRRTGEEKEAKEAKEAKEGKEGKEGKEAREPREPLLSPLLSAAGQRMVQAKRKASSRVSHGSTSSFGSVRDRDQQQWREDLKSRIRVIPEGGESGSEGGMI